MGEKSGLQRSKLDTIIWSSIINIMTKEIEKIIKKVVIESDKRFEKRLKHHTEALVEVLDDKFKIVSEQFKGVYEKFDNINESFDSLEKTLDSHTSILNSHTDTLDSHTERVGNIMMDMTEVKRDVKEIKYEIVVRLNNKVDKKHLIVLDQRVRRLEKK